MVQVVLCSSMCFSFKTVGYLQVIHQPLSRPKRVRAEKDVVGRKIGLERVNVQRDDNKLG
jgi:hypothetical protein